MITALTGPSTILIMSAQDHNKSLKRWPVIAEVRLESSELEDGSLSPTLA